MLPTKDAPVPPNARAADAVPSRSSDPVKPAAPVASQRPPHPNAGHGAHGHGTSQGHGQQGRGGAAREPRAQGSPNIQDVFLNYARREKLIVVIQLLDGQSVEGRIKNFDRFALVVDHGGVDHLVFKHAIATIRSPRSIGSYYASHEAS